MKNKTDRANEIRELQRQLVSILYDEGFTEDDIIDFWKECIKESKQIQKLREQLK